MADSITPRMEPPARILREVTVVGPQLPAIGDSPRALWVLAASAPFFGRDNAFDSAGKPNGVTADHAHPLRVVAADPGVATAAGRWQRPRLLSVHLVVGSDNLEYVDPAGGADESDFGLAIPIYAGSNALPSMRGKNLRSVAEQGEATSTEGKQGQFVQVVCEPLDSAVPWPIERFREIGVPAMRLVAGRIGLDVRLTGSSVWRSPMVWLLKLGIHRRKVSASTWATLWLTANGIEFDADVPFPAVVGTLPARVRLEFQDGRYVLTFLGATAGAEARWRDAWNAIVPDTGRQDDALVCCEFDANRGQLLPVFRWPVKILAHGAELGSGNTVRIPSRDLRVSLKSSSLSGTPDGVARLDTGEITARGTIDTATGATRVEFAFTRGDAPSGTNVLALDCRKDTAVLSMAASSGVALIADTDQLAQSLREVYGFPVPPPLGKGSQQGEAYGRPLLSAFVPLDDGWLQLPIPNLTALDTTNDLNLVSPSIAPRPAVFDGFVRFRQSGLSAAAQAATAGPAAPPLRRNPWVLTIERASGISGTVTVIAGLPKNGATLDGAVFRLVRASLSTRGLVWISTDRPDALDALPRLSAGPGAFLDLALRGTLGEDKAADALATTAAIVSARLEGLSISCDRRTSNLDSARLRWFFDEAAPRWTALMMPQAARYALRDDLFAIAGTSMPDTITPWSAVRWSRHANLPLAAAMAMTRTAGGAVQPLESRDLMPLTWPAERQVDPPSRLHQATLELTGDRVFPALAAPPGLPATRMYAWPWKARDDNAAAAPERGLAFALMGLPGAELRFGAPGTDEVALRFDLPVLDEAFATAPMPPPANPAANTEEPPRPVATALDWTLLAEHWGDQERRHQNSRVVESYLMRFRPLGGEHTVHVSNLIKGAVWPTTVKITSTCPSGLPLGQLRLDKEDLYGNVALEGFAGRFKLAGGILSRVPDSTAPTAGEIRVLGFAPQTHALANGVQLDNHGVGAAVPTFSGGLMRRHVLLDGGRVARTQASLLAPVKVRLGDVEIGFWCKDVLLTKLDAVEQFTMSTEAVAFDVWDDDEALLRAGYEWRLALNADGSTAEEADAAHRLGRGAFPWRGFWIEPLRLTTLRADSQRLLSCSVRCRVSLGPLGDGSTADNLVDIDLAYDPVNNRYNAGLGHNVGDDHAQPPVAASLQFDLLLPAGKHSRQRRVVVRSHLRVDAGVLAWTDTSVELDIAGVALTLDKAVIFPAAPGQGVRDDRVVVTAAGFAPSEAPGRASLALSDLHFTAGLAFIDTAATNQPTSATDGAVVAEPAYRQIVDLLPTLAMTVRARVAPHDLDDQSGSAAPLCDWTIRCTAEATTGSVQLFGHAVPGADLKFDEYDGVLALTASQKPAPDGVGASVSLLARLSSPVAPSNPAVLAIGYCVGSVAFADGQLLPGVMSKRLRLSFEARADGGERWRGSASVWGAVVANSAIQWPQLEWFGASAPVPIAMPGKKKAHNGRTRITPRAAAVAASHSVEYNFDQHRVGLGLLSAIAEGSGTALWSTLVVARHRVERPGQLLRWTSVDSFALGCAHAMIAPLTADSLDGASEHVTFSPRYKHAVENGKWSDDPEPGMRFAGFGTVAAVLQGIGGAAFRQAFWAGGNIPTNALLLCGGFNGLLETAAATAVPLLRLPLLAGIPGGVLIRQDGLVVSGMDLAWADGPAARRIALSRERHPSPASDALDAITAAVNSGSRPLSETADAESAGDVVAALWVEQVIMHPAPNGALSAAPYFLAAAVSLERVFAQMFTAGEIERTCGSLSLVAAARHLIDQGKVFQQPLVAVLRVQQSTLIPAERPESAWLYVVGERAQREPWRGAALTTADMSLGPLVRMRASLLDVDARAALVWISGSAYSAAATYPYNGSALQPVAARPSSVRFHDCGRGANLLPKQAQRVPPWLVPPVEGATKPIRDDAKITTEDGVPSGLAGLTGVLALPAHASGERSTSDVGDDLVWLSQTRIPVYLPLRSQSLLALPIPWLTPAPARVRLPLASEVDNALRAGDSGPARLVQQFLPTQLSGTSLSERAGILTARRSRLLAALGDVVAFDGANSRFGRPGQAGSSVPRKLRTPRPSIIPENGPDAALHRRVQASVLLPRQSFAAFSGSADALGGERSVLKYGREGNPDDIVVPRWTLRIVAASASGSVVSDRWNGDIGMSCQLDIEGALPARVDPRTVLAALLFGEHKFDDNNRVTLLQSSALLKLGDLVVAYHWLDILAFTPFEPIVDSGTCWRSTVSLLLSRRDAAQKGSDGPSSAIVQALAAGTVLPHVEVQWTAYPSDAGRSVLTVFPALALTPLPPTQPPLVQGGDRAPVTLRLRLYPITEQRGALALTPVSLVFEDPAYDRELAGPPAVASLPLTGAKRDNGDPLDPARGQLQLMLSADRGRLNRRGEVTLMLDVRFQRRLDEVAQAVAQTHGAGAGGDLIENASQSLAMLALKVEPRDGVPRALQSPAAAILRPGSVYSMALSTLRETDGSPAQLRAGDILVLEARFSAPANSPPLGTPVNLWDQAYGASMTVMLSSGTNTLSVALRLLLTDESIVEPPSALYAALLRTEHEPGRPRIATVLHAQSPLPWRVDLIAPALDFRLGVMRRRATFIWALLRPEVDFVEHSLCVLKYDRNGQTYIPETLEEFVTPHRI